MTTFELIGIYKCARELCHLISIASSWSHELTILVDWRNDLLQIGQYDKLGVDLCMEKGNIKKLVLNYLVEEEIFAEEDLECVALSRQQPLELRKLEYQERDKALQIK